MYKISILIAVIFIMAVSCAKYTVTDDRHGYASGVTFAQVEGCVLNAPTPIGWIMSPVNAGIASGAYDGGDYFIDVRVRYDASGFMISYNDSENLKYDSIDRKIEITYNEMVSALQVRIAGCITVL